jgi:hypothetical protein
MKPLLVLSLICIVAAALSWHSYISPGNKNGVVHQSKKEFTKPVAANIPVELKLKAEAARLFVKRNGFNENFCFLINMSLPSGQNRFFVYNLKTDSLQAQGLVAHGNCFEYWLEGRRYSNAVGSGCTSLGKYKIGIHYTGKFGYSYKLHGLDSSNKNAFERTVVLHSHSCVPETATTDEICQSNGCPTVAPDFLQKLKAIINNSKKPVLLWIYE